MSDSDLAAKLQKLFTLSRRDKGPYMPFTTGYTGGEKTPHGMGGGLLKVVYAEKEAIEQEAAGVGVALSTIPDPHQPLIDDFESWSDVALISSPFDRLACFHLGVRKDTGLCTVYNRAEMLIGNMHCQTIIDFLGSLGYVKVGEENFSDSGLRVPCFHTTWVVRDKTATFVSNGWQFFINPKLEDGNEEKNVVILTEITTEAITMGYCTRSFKFSQKLKEGHNEYTKQHNMLRGAKLRNVNVSTSSFEEVDYGPEHSWDNYYYPPTVKDAFVRYIQRFLERNAEYNERGITKRGILFKGPPGSGKTSLGKVACNLLKDFSFLWITSDVLVENSKGMSAIKKLYQLADYLSPCAAFLEDLDLFGEDRDGRSETIALGSMMNVLDGVNSMANIVTIATTNRPELIERALIGRPGRFDAIVEVPVFIDELRWKMFKDRFGAIKVDDGVLSYLVANSHKWSGATMQEYLNVVNMILIERNVPFPDRLTMELAKEAITMIQASTPAAANGTKSTGFAAEK